MQDRSTPLSQTTLWILHSVPCIHRGICDFVSLSAIGFLYHFRFVVAVRSMPPINSANSSRVNCTRPSSDVGQFNRPCSMRRAQTHRLLLSKKSIFMRSLLELANRKKCPPHCTRLVSVCLPGCSFVLSWLFSSLERDDLFRGRFDVKVLGSVVRPIADDTAFPAPVDDGQVLYLDLACHFLYGKHSFVP